jgi:hypothetical protein
MNSPFIIIIVPKIRGGSLDWGRLSGVGQPTPMNFSWQDMCGAAKPTTCLKHSRVYHFHLSGDDFNHHDKLQSHTGCYSTGVPDSTSQQAASTFVRKAS